VRVGERWRSLAVVTAIVVGVGSANQWWHDRSRDRFGAEVAAAARPGDIRMLASETCEYCVDARIWFGAHRVPFSECTVERDAACAADFERTRAAGTPVFIVRGQTLVGFAPRAIAQALGAAT
jgi:hypothetical protein